MVYPVWHSFYEIGVDFIDEDHKHLISIMQDIISSFSANNRANRLKLLNKFLSATREHFIREEKYLADVGFPGLEEHKIFHNQLLIQADITREMCKQNISDNHLKECIDKLIQLVIDDIFKGDIKFKSYLEYEGYID